MLPEPSRVARVMMMLRAVGILFGGVGIFVLALLGRDLVHTAANNSEEAACRAEIQDELVSQQSKINATGWTAMLAAFRDDQASVDLHAVELQGYLDDLPGLRDRSEDRFDLCSQ